MATASYCIAPERLVLPFFLRGASVLVAAMRGQLNQKRKLEIRSSSHKSLQSPKGP